MHASNASLSLLNYLTSNLKLNSINVDGTTSKPDEIFGLGKLYTLTGDMHFDERELQALPRVVSAYNRPGRNPVYELRSSIRIAPVARLGTGATIAAIQEASDKVATHDFSIYIQRTGSPVTMFDGQAAVDESNLCKVSFVPHSMFLSIITAALALGQISVETKLNSHGNHLVLVSTEPLQMLMADFIEKYGFIEGETITIEHDHLLITGGGLHVTDSSKQPAVSLSIAAPNTINKPAFSDDETKAAAVEPTENVAAVPADETRPIKAIMSFAEAVAASQAEATQAEVPAEAQEAEPVEAEEPDYELPGEDSEPGEEPEPEEPETEAITEAGSILDALMPTEVGEPPANSDEQT